MCVLGSPTPTPLMATTLNSKSTQGLKPLTVAWIICPGTESGTRIQEFRIVMGAFCPQRHILVTVSPQRWWTRAEAVGLRSPGGTTITAKWALIVAPDARPEGRATFHVLLPAKLGSGTRGRRCGEGGMLSHQSGGRIQRTSSGRVEDDTVLSFLKRLPAFKRNTAP